MFQQTNYKKQPLLLIEKQQLISILKTTNRQVLKTFIILKQEFCKKQKQIPNHQISNYFKTWKLVLSKIIQRNLVTITKKQNKIEEKNQDIFQKQFDYKTLVKQMTTLYGKDQQYIECIKCLNSTIQMMKQFIRIKAIKDPTTAIYASQLNFKLPSNNNSLTKLL